MGLSGAGVNRFRGRVDAVLDDMFPCVLVFGEVELHGSGPGSRVASPFLDGGEAVNIKAAFRVPVLAGVTAPAVGDSMAWRLPDGTEIPLEVIETAIRPHEDRWSFTCKKRRV